jgi:thiol-disulfide isomerase/thioredoxin
MRTRAGFVALVAFASAACEQAHDAPGAAQHRGPSAAAGPSVTGAPSTPLVLAPPGIHWMQGPSGLTDASAPIRDALVQEHASGRTLLIYVGATWCEPCQRFHHAVEQGELDALFPHLSVLAFDADRDSEALATAGYVSRLIPLFAIPRTDGHASGKQIEGSVKGGAAVGEITPRLQALITSGS